MAQLGILGGMGPQATQGFYQRIIDGTQATCDQDHLPTLILCDTGMPDRTGAILSGETQPVLERMLADANRLIAAGCTHLGMPCNTAHFFVPALQAALPVPFLHMIELTVAQLKAKGCKRVGIMGTNGTLEAGVYQKVCEANGITAISPSPEIQALVMDLIYNQIKAGQPGNPETFAAIHADLVAQNCDAAVLACTELSVYRDNHGVPDLYIDPMDVLAKACIEACGYPLK